MVSTAPPVGQGTTSLMGLFGHWAAPAHRGEDGKRSDEEHGRMRDMEASWNDPSV